MVMFYCEDYKVVIRLHIADPEVDERTGGGGGGGDRHYFIVSSPPPPPPPPPDVSLLSCDL